jgi:hypothetical protein
MTTLVKARETGAGWTDPKVVSFMQVLFPPGSKAKSGSGHIGATGHYAGAIYMHTAIQLSLRLILPSYPGKLVHALEPGLPEMWTIDYGVIPPVKPAMMLPPLVAPFTMTWDLVPVSRSFPFPPSFFL